MRCYVLALCVAAAGCGDSESGGDAAFRLHDGRSVSWSLSCLDANPLSELVCPDGSTLVSDDRQGVEVCRIVSVGQLSNHGPAAEWNRWTTPHTKRVEESFVDDVREGCRTTWDEAGRRTQATFASGAAHGWEIIDGRRAGEDVLIRCMERGERLWHASTVAEDALLNPLQPCPPAAEMLAYELTPPGAVVEDLSRPNQNPSTCEITVECAVGHHCSDVSTCVAECGSGADCREAETCTIDGRCISAASPE